MWALQELKVVRSLGVVLSPRAVQTQTVGKLAQMWVEPYSGRKERNRVEAVERKFLCMRGNAHIVTKTPNTIGRFWITLIAEYNLSISY